MLRRAVDADPLGFAFIFPPGSESRSKREKFEERNTEKRDGKWQKLQFYFLKLSKRGQALLLLTIEQSFCLF